jgi:hypothetical protein
MTTTHALCGAVVADKSLGLRSLGRSSLPLARRRTLESSRRKGDNLTRPRLRGDGIRGDGGQSASSLMARNPLGLRALFLFHK